MRRVLWVFAHQDDELAAAALIAKARTNGSEVWCAFLTDGAARVAASIRNDESTKALAQLGIGPETIYFDGSVPDGQLIDHLDGSLERLEQRMREVVFDEVGCLAWEGGHHDHDASHMIAVAFAKRRGVEAVEVPLYNGGGPFFRVLRAVGRGWESHDISFRDGLRIIGLVRFYRSQTRTWLALFPEAWFRLVVLRRTHARRVDAKRLHDAPHAGTLFYERRFKVPRERFLRAAAPFLAKHFEANTKSCPVCGGHRFARRQLLPHLAVDRCESCGLRLSEIAKTNAIDYAHIDENAYEQSIAIVRREQAKAIVAMVNERGSWLDIGCGYGFVLDEARARGFTVRGVEPDEKAAAEARARLGDVIKTSDDEPADVISTLDVIEHFEPSQLDAFAQDVKRRAKVWVIKVPASEGLFFQVAHALLPFTRGAVKRLWQSEHAHPHTIYFDRTTLLRFLEKHGFTIEVVRYLDERADRQRLLVDPTIVRWQVTLATPLIGAINFLQRRRRTSDALLVIARSDRR